jgi:hypothetical protein
MLRLLSIVLYLIFTISAIVYEFNDEYLQANNNLLWALLVLVAAIRFGDES